MRSQSGSSLELRASALVAVASPPLACPCSAAHRPDSGGWAQKQNHCGPSGGRQLGPSRAGGRPAKLEGRSRAKAGPCNFDQRADSPTRPARESALRASLDGAPGSGAERGHQCRRAGRLAAARCCGLETCSAQQVDHSRGEIIHEIFIGRPASAAGVKRELQRGATRGRAESKPVASCEREPMKGARSCLVRAGEFYANLRRV